MKPNMMLAGIAVLAMTAAPAAAQSGNTGPFRLGQPARTPHAMALQQPSNLELMARLNELSVQVEQLSGQVKLLTDRLTALNNHVGSLSGGIGELAQQEHAHYVTIANAALATCGLLYLHHWKTNSPGHPWQSSLFCEGKDTENGIYNRVQ